MLFRSHGSNLDTVKESIVELNNREEFIEHCKKIHREIFCYHNDWELDPERLTVELYVYSIDEHFGWPTTYIVYYNGVHDKEQGVLGFTDSPVLM